MGLDTVELVMELEDHFRIRMTDERCEAVRTVGQLCDYVVELLAQAAYRPSFGCRTAHAFYELRSTLLRELVYAVPARSIRPDTSLNALLGAHGRYATWTRVQRTMNFSWPRVGLIRRIRGELFPERTTVADAVRQIVKVDPGRWYSDGGAVNAKAVWDDVQTIVSEQFGVRREEIQPHVRIIEDLCC